MFTFLATLAKTLLGYSEDGTIFITDSDVPTLGWFLVLVVPPIIFFVALVQLLSYWGLVQWGVKKFAVFFLVSGQPWHSHSAGDGEVAANLSCFCFTKNSTPCRYLARKQSLRWHVRSSET